MDFDGPTGGFPITRIFLSIIGGAIWIFSLLIAIALIFLFVRFLLVATRAAQIYVSKHDAPAVPAPGTTDAASETTDAEPTEVVAPTVAGPAPEAMSSVAPASVVPPAEPVAPTKPPVARKPRTPRTPPS